MINKGWGLFRLGLKRRRKEVLRMRLMMCIAVFFLTFIFLFQDNMNGYQMALNYSAFGRWLACSESRKLGTDPYLTENGAISRGSLVYSLWPREQEFKNDGLLKDKDVWYINDDEHSEPEEELIITKSDGSRYTNCYIGTFSPGMAEHNNIEIREGRLPENDGEIAMELSLLDVLGQGYELGNEISFYVSRFDDYLMLQQLVSEYFANYGKPDSETDEEDDYGVHYDYDVTEIPARNELYLVKFTLVGTLQRYTTRWDTGMSGGESGYLPGAIITQSDFDRLEMSKRVYRFFDLRPEYVTQDVWRFAGERMDAIESAEEYSDVSFSLNRNAYNNPLWGNPTMYRSITILLIVISACIIAYLMANYLGKRRSFFLRMREIGASTGDVWKMAAYECVGSVLPAAAVTFVCSYALSVIVVLIAAKLTGVGFFYVFSLKTMLTVILAALLTLGVSLLAALVIFSGRSLGAKSKTLSRSAVKRLKKHSERKRAGKKVGSKPYRWLLETLKRDRIAHKLKNRLLSAISVIVCAIVILCTVKTYQPTVAYFKLEKERSDFYGETKSGIRYIDVKVPIEEFWDGHKIVDSFRYAWSREGFSSSRLFARGIVEAVSTMVGVNSVDWRCDDFTHFITFEGRDDDPFFQTYLNTYLVNNQPLRGEYELDLSHNFSDKFIKAMERDLYGILTKMDSEKYWRRYEKFLDPAVADREAFLNGEQVIAIVDTEMTRAIQSRDLNDVDNRMIETRREKLLVPEKGTFGGAWYGYEPSFAPGDELTVQCRNGEEVKVVVAGIVPLSSSGFGNDNERFLTLLGADAFMQRICSADKNRWNYNSFDADLDVVFATERIVNDLANICAQYGVVYENNILTKSEYRAEMIRAAVVYGFFGVILAVLFFFVTLCISKDEETRLGDKYRMLSCFGMTVDRMKKEKRVDALCRTLPILCAFPVYLVMRFVSEFKYNIGLFKGSVSVFKALWSFMIGAEPILALIVLGAFALLYWLVISRMDKEWRKTI